MLFRCGLNYALHRVHLDIVLLHFSGGLAWLLDHADHRGLRGKHLIPDRAGDILFALKRFQLIVRGQLKQGQAAWLEGLSREAAIDRLVGQGVVVGVEPNFEVFKSCSRRYLVGLDLFMTENFVELGLVLVPFIETAGKARLKRPAQSIDNLPRQVG